MRVRWTAEARSDLVRLYDFLSPVNRQAAARAVQSLRAAPARLLRYNPRLGARVEGFAPREVRRLFVGDYELRYEIQDAMIIIVRLWHTREDR
jgi:plasmid stabilization system protein ParE